MARPILVAGEVRTRGHCVTRGQGAREEWERGREEDIASHCCHSAPVAGDLPSLRGALPSCKYRTGGRGSQKGLSGGSGQSGRGGRSSHLTLMMLQGLSRDLWGSVTSLQTVGDLISASIWLSLTILHAAGGHWEGDRTPACMPQMALSPPCISSESQGGFS